MIHNQDRGEDETASGVQSEENEEAVWKAGIDGDSDFDIEASKACKLRCLLHSSPSGDHYYGCAH